MVVAIMEQIEVARICAACALRAPSFLISREGGALDRGVGTIHPWRGPFLIVLMGCGDSKISLARWGLEGASREAKLKKCFAHLDHDKNGVLTFDEILALSKSLEKSELEEARIEFEAMDHDGDRELTEPEYIESCKKVYKRIHESDFDLWVYAVLTSTHKTRADLKKAHIHIGRIKKKSKKGKYKKKAVQPK